MEGGVSPPRLRDGRVVERMTVGDIVERTVTVMKIQELYTVRVNV